MSEISLSWRLGGRHVLVAGSFSDWKAIPMIYNEYDASWNIALKIPKTSPTYYYKFIVDGGWFYDYTTETVIDQDGHINNVGIIATTRADAVISRESSGASADASAGADTGAGASADAGTGADAQVREGPKTLVIIRGASGSGKTTLALKLLEQNEAKVHAEADKKMLNDKGQYVFNPKNLGAAHAGCVRDIEEGMKESHHFLVVSNTSTCYWEMYQYVRLAQQYGYEIQFLEPDTEWSKNADLLFEKNSHAVPLASIKNQLDNLAKNPTLPTPQMIAKILQTLGCRPCTYRAGINALRFFSYGFPADKVAPFTDKLKLHLGEDLYAEMYKNLCARDGGINEHLGVHVYHMTLNAFEVEEDKYFADEKNRKNYHTELKQIKSQPTFLGVGKLEKEENVTYFVVVEWPELAKVRKNLNLKALDLHVTLAFKKDDIHNLPKNQQTIFLK